MRLIVQKYGGTSVGSAERIRNVAARLIETQRSGAEVVAVISAMSGVTDQLLKLAGEVSPQPSGSEREMDALLATGEQTSIALVAMAVNALGGKAISLTGAQAGIVTDRAHTRAKISNINPKLIEELVSEGFIVVVAGFQGRTVDGETTTLGRGGSDLTAIALAGALGADACQIFTDVDGVFSCDPRVVPDATQMQEIAYDELLEMAGAGAKVMQSRAVEFAKKFGVPFEVRSSFGRKAGTVAKEETASMEDVVIRGITIERKQAKITMAGVPDAPGTASRIFSAVSAANVLVDMIVQNASDQKTTDISFTIHEGDLPQTEELLRPVAEEIGAERIATQSGVAKLSVVGIGMRSHAGVATRLFDCLGEGGVNIQLISTSEIKIAVVIEERDADRAAQLTHAAFGLAKPAL
ncbi:MAG: aspartate kinase [Chthoniobacterales bacterium]|nr:aspartate kinase [Chthoniobacterales bacterium]